MARIEFGDATDECILTMGRYCGLNAFPLYDKFFRGHKPLTPAYRAHMIKAMRDMGYIAIDSDGNFTRGIK